MIYDLINQGFENDENYNCAEKILHASNKAYNLNLSKDALILSGGFGGGMGIQSTCGALTGAIMALSSFVIEDNAKNSDIRNIVIDFLTTYEKRMGSIYCDELKSDYFTDKDKCQTIMLEAAKLLDETFIKIKNNSL